MAVPKLNTLHLEAEVPFRIQAPFLPMGDQPQAITDQIIKRVNPLVEFKEIPFPVTFKIITMNETEAKMTGFPQKFKGGVTAVWMRP